MDNTVHVRQRSEQVIPRLVDTLERQDFKVTTSFDLRLARAGHFNCNCPHHGRADCNCQYAVLLIFAPENVDRIYRTVIVHGQDDTVWLTLLQDPKRDPNTSNIPAREAVETILMDAFQSLTD